MWVISVVVAFLTVIFATAVNWYLSSLKYASLKNVPGPKPLPIIGNANEFGRTTVDLLHSFMNLNLKYGSIYKLWIGSRLHLIISKPEYLAELLTSNIHLSKSTGYDLFKPWLGDGLLVSTGRKWKIRRKMITPTFHFKILEKFMKVFNAQFDIMLDILDEQAGKKPGCSVDVTKYINLASLDIICETAFGTPLRAQTQGNPEYVRSLATLLEIIALRFFSAWLSNPIVFRLSSFYRKYSDSLKIMHGFTNKIIEERKKEFENDKVSRQKAAEDGIKKKCALLDMLLEANDGGKELTNENIREEVDTFMFEGHDTSSTAIGFTLYAICQNPDVQTKLYQELLDIVGTDSTTEITISQINDLKYLDIVVKEAMRMYPPVPHIERELEENWIIDGLDIPKGTAISIFIYAMNHSSDVFPDPEKFDPERFLPEKQASRHTYAYIPFSAGPRNCIGQKFALYELKTCIIKFMLRFELIADSGFIPEIGMSSVLKSRNGIRMKLKPRK